MIEDRALVPDHLYNDIKQSRVALLCGSGITTEGGPHGTPTFYETIRDRFAIFPDNPNPPFPDLMEHFCAMLDGGDKRRLIQEAISRIERFTSPGELQRSSSMVYSLVAKIPYFDRIVTTNWDPFCERALNVLVPMVEDRDLPFWNDDKRQVLKIHGCITRPDTIVLTRHDVESSIGKNRLIWNTLKNLMATRLFIVIGYSMRDDDFLSVFREITMTLGPFKGLTYAYDPNASDELISFWSEKKVRIIRGTALSFVQALLEKLREDDTLPSPDLMAFLAQEKERIQRMRALPTDGGPEPDADAGLSAAFRNGVYQSLQDVLDSEVHGVPRSLMDQKLREAQRMRDQASAKLEMERMAYWSGHCEVLRRFNERIMEKIPSNFNPRKLAPAHKGRKTCP